MAEKYSVLLILIAAILWGTTGTAQTFAPNEATPLVIGAIRLAIGGLTLLTYVVAKGDFNRKSWSIKQVILASLCMAAYQPLFFSAVSSTGVAVGTVVGIGSAPILAGLIEFSYRKRIPKMKWWVATVLAIVGCSLLFLTDQALNVDPIGVILALGAGLAFAIYTIVSKQLVASHKSEEVAAVVFSLAAILLAPILVVSDLSWLTELKGAAVALHLGIVTTAIAYLLFGKGLTGVASEKAVTLSLAEPLTAAVLGIVLVGEKLSVLGYLGLSSLFTGLVILVYERNKVAENNFGGDEHGCSASKRNC